MFPDRKCKSKCNCTRGLAVTLGRLRHHRLHQRGLTDPRLSLSASTAEASTEPVQTPRDSDQDAADQRTGRNHRTPEVNFAIRPGNRADATISRSVDRRMFPAMTSSSIIARATCPPGAVAQNSFAYLLQPVKGIR